MGTLQSTTEPLRVAIIASSARQKLNLRSILESNSVCVIPEDELTTYLASAQTDPVADVLLVDLDETDEQGIETLDALIEKSKLPILYNDSAATRNQFSANGMAWGRRLAEKLLEMALAGAVNAMADSANNGAMPVICQSIDAADQSDQVRGNAMPDSERENGAASSDPLAIAEDIDIQKYQSKLAQARASAGMRKPAEGALRAELTPTKHEGKAATHSGQFISRRPLLARESADLDPNGAEYVWILGASLGGPQAVKQFLAAIPAGLPVGFILAQHIGNHFVPLLAEQFDRICPLKVMAPRTGHLLANGELVVSPVNRRMVFTRSGHVALKPVIKKTKYAPSIDQLLVEAAYRFGARAGAIIFSGMGNDGSQGVRLVAHKGGTVWAQDADSCIMSSMSDSARKTGCVEYSGNPSQLANQLVKLFKG